MKQTGFSAQELYCMAQVCKKRHMFGIYDGFESVPEEEVAAAKATVMDSLLDKGVLTINLDGATYLDDDYNRIISFVCDADKCITVSYQNVPSDRYEDVIFWKTGEAFLKATAYTDQYVFSEANKKEFDDYLTSLFSWEPTSEKTETIIIPKIVLINAKKTAVEKDGSYARTYLLRHGAGDSADLLLPGLLGTADFLGIQFVDNTAEGNNTRIEMSWLFSGNTIFELSNEIVNYHSCLKMKPCDSDSINNEINRLLLNFE